MTDITIYTPTIVGRRVTNGYSARTTNLVGNGIATSISIIGNGVNDVRLSVSANHIRTALTGWVYLSLSDSLATVQQAAIYAWGANIGGDVNMDFVYPAFTGSKTFYTYLYSSPGIPTLVAAGSYPHTLEARWA